MGTTHGGVVSIFAYLVSYVYLYILFGQMQSRDILNKYQGTTDFNNSIINMTDQKLLPSMRIHFLDNEDIIEKFKNQGIENLV